MERLIICESLNNILFRNCQDNVDAINSGYSPDFQLAPIIEHIKVCEPCRKEMAKIGIEAFNNIDIPFPIKRFLTKTLSEATK